MGGQKDRKAGNSRQPGWSSMNKIYYEISQLFHRQSRVSSPAGHKSDNNQADYMIQAQVQHTDMHREAPA